MHRLRMFLKSILTPVTIMVVPHSREKPIGLRVPYVGIFLAILVFLAGTCFVAAATVRTIEYYSMKEQLGRLTSRFHEMNATVHSLQAAEEQFRKLFSLKSKREVLEKFQAGDAGSLDMDLLKKQIEESMNSVSGIRKYISEQKNIYLATPSGWPAPGRISSGYGERDHPLTGEWKFHSGMDISVPRGTRVTTTADGIVSFSAWSPGSGNTVVIEHGHGFSTAYAHNERNLVRVGQRVKRGSVIAESGSTGSSTGPHVHYEIWKSGRHVDPAIHLSRS